MMWEDLGKRDPHDSPCAPARATQTVVLPVHHLAVVSSDLERSRQFYVDVLGLSEIRRWTDDHGVERSIWVQLGNDTFLAIERCAAEAPTRTDEAPGWHCVAFGISGHERASWHARLEAAGVPIERESDYTLYVRDPDGNLIGLSHYPHHNPDGRQD